MYQPISKIDTRVRGCLKFLFVAALIPMFLGCFNKNTDSESVTSGTTNGSAPSPSPNTETGNCKTNSIVESRVKYHLSLVEFGQSCVSENQSRTCQSGDFSSWSGTFLFDACLVAANSDVDSDGILNASDNCPSGANSKQNDIDRDGIGDVCDQDFVAKVNLIID